MSNRYNFFYFEAEFKKYLLAGNAEHSTIKNYVSDLHFFFSWIKMTQAMDELAYSELPELFTHTFIRTYHSYLESSTSSTQTVNRRLSTIRKFFRLCVDQRWMNSSPMDRFDDDSKADEKEEVIHLYRKALRMKNMPETDIDRHINVIKSLIIHSNTL